MSSLETKTLSGEEALADLHRAFAAFKDTNEERIAQIETRMGVDALTEEKLQRIDRSIDETKRRIDRVALDVARPRLASTPTDDAPAREHKSAFALYMRSGEAVGLKALESKALSAGSGPDGGYLVPTPAEREILRRLARISPIRAIASVREISTHSLRKAYSTQGPAAGWVAEADPRPQTSSQQIVDLTFPAMELYAMPAATQTLLDDSAIDVERWIAEEVQTVFAEQEGAAFVNGNGTDKPKGFLAYSAVADASWSWGSIGYVATGVSGGFAASNPSDALFNLVYALRAGYRQNGTFVLNRQTQSTIRKFKTTTGDYLWAPPASLDQPASLLNFPVVEAEDMPNIGADSFSVAFGDFSRGYLVVDRLGVRVLRDPYSAKPYVLFYTTKRVGGGVQDFEALKLLKFGAA
ncbi:MAG TPA: phage major capsid protein [Methylosinus sp.]|jgi:HK97 family phage major capsid protein|uniref:phage major capsid protein n=1 Tax=Methylosinus sp. TaxID=427 RepID=UPI002F951392